MGRYNASNPPPPNGPQWEPKPGDKPDPDPPRAQYIAAKNVIVGDMIMVVHRQPLRLRSRYEKVTQATEFERGRTVVDVSAGDSKLLTFRFVPVHGSASVLADVDPERHFQLKKAAPR